MFPGAPNHCLYRPVLSFSLLSWGKLRWKPATKRLDWSFAPILKFDKRFARQYCYGLPPRFLLASAYSSIARRFSGPNMTCSNSNPSPKTQLGEHWGAPSGTLGAFCISFAIQLDTVRLACTLDSLVRVSRRVEDPVQTHLTATKANLHRDASLDGGIPGLQWPERPDP